MYNLFPKVRTLKGLKDNIDDAIDNNGIVLEDHLEGFSDDLGNPLLSFLDSKNFKDVISLEYEVSDELKKRWHNLNLVPNIKMKRSIIFSHFEEYNIHPTHNYVNLICSFNGAPHVGRQLLTSIMHSFGMFEPMVCSKNFKYSKEHIDGHLLNFGLSDKKQRLYKKFFSNDDEFLNNVYSFGFTKYDHKANIHTLENKLTSSFIHLVSETKSTSYYPFITEKFMYSVVTRGLFIANAQPRWHHHLEKFYGFKKYDTIFDYSFDDIKNPIERLVRLMEMIGKFSKLSIDDWNDLYLMEQDTVEYNYDHFFSKRYVDCINQDMLIT